MSIDQRRVLVRIVMGRADSWLFKRVHEGDRVLYSLGVVLRVAWRVFFWRWMASDDRNRATKRERHRDFLSRYGVWIALLLLIVGLLALGVQPAFASTPQDKRSTDASDYQVLAYRFSDLGEPEGLQLRGGGSQAGLFVPISDNLAVTQATMTLHIAKGELQPGARLIVEVNGVPVKNLKLDGTGESPQTHRFAIAPSFFLSANRINFRLLASADNLCPNPLDPRIWVRLAAHSQLQVTARHLPFVGDLSRLPAPFIDSRAVWPATVHMVLPEHPDNATVQAAAQVASWFGVQAGHRDVRFIVANETLPAGDAVVFAVNGSQPPGLPLPSVSEPRLSVISNPQNGLRKLLVIQAPSSRGLIEAVRSLIHAGAALQGASAPASTVAIAPRRPYDAPGWLDTNKALRFDELAEPSGLRVVGLYPRQVTVRFHVAPDLFHWPGETVPLSLHYRFPQGKWLDEEKSHLDVALNGEYLKSLPVNQRGMIDHLWGWFGGDRRKEDALIRIPPERIHSENRLTFYFNLRYTLEGECNPALPSQVVSQIYPDSTLDLGGARHLAALPDLSLFASAGFPFSVYADLSKTALVLPEHPDNATISALLGVVAHIGAATGVPASGMRVVQGSADLPTVNKRHWLVVAALSEPLVDDLLSTGPFDVDQGRLRVPPAGLRPLVRNLVHGRWRLDQLEADRALSSRKETAVLLGLPTPADKGQQMVVVTASESRLLPELVAHLNDPATLESIHGDLALIDDTGASSWRVAPVTLHGGRSERVRVLWTMGQRPLLMLLILMLLVLVAVLALHPVLRRRAERRLREGRGRSDND